MQKRRCNAEWKELIANQRASGQGVKQWCDKNGISVSSMYNQIAKHRKQESNSDCNPKNVKSRDEVDSPRRVEWKELKTTAAQEHVISQKRSISIEMGGMRLSADEGYPVMSLAMLCKELLGSC